MTKGWMIAATLGYLAFEYISDKIKEAKEKKAEEAAKKVEKNFTPPAAVLKDSSISTGSKVLENYLAIESDFVHFLNRMTPHEVARGYAVANLSAKTFNYLFETDKGKYFRTNLNLYEGYSFVEIPTPQIFGDTWHLVGIGVHDYLLTQQEAMEILKSKHPRTNGIWLSSYDPFAPDGKIYHFAGDTDQFYFDD